MRVCVGVRVYSRGQRRRHVAPALPGAQGRGEARRVVAMWNYVGDCLLQWACQHLAIHISGEPACMYPLALPLRRAWDVHSQLACALDESVDICASMCVRGGREIEGRGKKEGERERTRESEREREGGREREREQKNPKP